jgi:hypothetical protein
VDDTDTDTNLVRQAAVAVATTLALTSISYVAWRLSEIYLGPALGRLEERRQERNPRALPR